MSMYVLTTDSVGPVQIEAYAREHSRRAAAIQGLAALWAVKFGPLTQVLMLQSAPDRTPFDFPPAPEVPEGFILQNRERQLIREMKSFVPPDGEVKVLELRIYNALPGKAADFLELMLATIGVRERYSANFGVWASVSGRSDQIMHLWGYSGIDHRDKVRERLKGDVEWQAYVPKILPMLEQLNSIILTPVRS